MLFLATNAVDDEDEQEAFAYYFLLYVLDVPLLYLFECYVVRL